MERQGFLVGLCAVAVPMLLALSLVTVAGVGREPITPLPAVHAEPAAKVELGRRLFHDPRLSGDDTVACASCHDLRRSGVDGLPHSVGIAGAVGERNAPTVLNSGLNFRQFWDGRAATLEEQAVGPVHNPIEMGSNWPQVVDKLGRDPEYPQLFAALYDDGITGSNIADAIASFERSLLTPNSPFDRYLRGDESAISVEAKEGYRLFKGYGCISCHQGVSVGGNMYQRFGIFGDYFSDRGRAPHPSDYGRFTVTGRDEDKFVFKVPGLRNVTLTAPYLHDGEIANLEEVVRLMARYQLGVEIPDGEVDLIVQFLRSLSGELPEGGH